MNVTRDIVLDLLPVYLSGEASPDTRALVEEYMKQDEDLARRIRLQWAESLAKVSPTSLPPELELRSLRRTRGLLGWQRWLFGFAITFSALSLTSEIQFEGGGVKEFRFLIRDFPAQFGTCLLLGLACWLAYYLIRRRLRVTGL